MTNEAPAGWYPDPQEPGLVRYWTGTQWSTDSRVALAESVESTPVKKRSSRRVPVWVALTAGAVGLFLGVGFGANSASTNTDSVTALESELTDALNEVDNTETALQVTEDSLQETEDSLKEAEAALESAQSDFKTEKKGLVLQAKEATKVAEAAEARAIAAEASASEQAPLPVAETSAPQPEIPPVYYENCTAARNAGGAPVYLGGPGYGTHLDRDGDGVGCE